MEECVPCKFWQNPKRPAEKFKYLFGWLSYDIEHAKKMVQDGRPVQKVDLDNLRRFIDYTGVPGQLNILTTMIYDDHIDHVPDSQKQPIILAYAPENAKGERGRMPIDGHHRIAKAIKHHQPIVYAYLLSKEETDSILTDHREKIPKRKRSRKK